MNCHVQSCALQCILQYEGRETSIVCQQENEGAVNSAKAPVPAPMAAAKAAAPVGPATPDDREQQMAALVCSLENKDACLMCGS